MSSLDELRSTDHLSSSFDELREEDETIIFIIWNLTGVIIKIDETERMNGSSESIYIIQRL